MPFKNLSGPRKVGELSAEVRASAYLASPGLVAMLTTDPVRLSVHPAGTTSCKITTLSLVGADHVALLSRDVALVRATDDAVWALFDITHTAKLEQVASDIRALAMRPAGGSALALGWDGSATLLTQNRHEIDARTFSLRGDVRAVDLTDDETYALMGGADGPQLRVHPGDTPEAAVRTRVQLPAEASTFDRIRGGAKLSAVYRRGGRSVCLIAGGQARGSAKMVELEADAADIAVLDTSLFAVFADGRAALYDADAIARADDGGPIEARSAIALGARGQPRSITLPNKGSPVLWVGTSGGDVVSVTVLRKTGI